MAETLLTLLLVTTSAKGSNLIFRWPELPSPSPRLSRARPDDSLSISLLDNPWRASHSQGALERAELLPPHDYGHDPDYCWPRPNALRDTRNSFEKIALPDEYEHVLGYSAEFLANLLCPQRSMCHQKFELVVDDLAFIGHPVCVESDGEWKFKPEKIITGTRERELDNSVSPHAEESASMSSPIPTCEPSSTTNSTWLHTFHLALVLDLPDPSSSASGNLTKYFNTLYEEIAFTLTAVLYQEQVLSNFVEKECDMLIALKESCMSKGEPFSKYATQALETSSIARSMRTIFEAVKSSSMAYVTINDLPLEIQLPPYLDTLLHSQDDQEIEFNDPSDNDATLTWGEHMAIGWKLPTMAPWKTLQPLDDETEMDPEVALAGPHESAEDRTLAEGLLRFLHNATPTFSLQEMSTLLDWDLETQIYPVVRWLVLHRRAKVVDVIHRGLRTAFALPPKFGAPLSQLSADFAKTFPHPAIRPLPEILAAISTSMSKQTDSHFFACVVKSKELIPLYQEVVSWMLKRDMIIVLHLRIRVVATSELKARVKAERGLRKLSKVRSGNSDRHKHRTDYNESISTSVTSNGSGMNPSFFFSPRTAHKFASRISSNESGRSEMSELNFDTETTASKTEKVTESDNNSEVDEGDSGWDTTEDHLSPSIICDPGKATPVQRLWLSAMSDGKEPVVGKRFELINQYFDGKKSDDEILYRANITRKELREVLHHYEEYLQTFLHPS